MAYVIKLLANGQVSDSLADIYKPVGAKAIVKTVTFVNTDAGPLTLNVYLKPSGGSARCVFPKNYSLAAGDLAILDSEFTLGDGDAIQAVAGAAAKVDFTVNGVEET